MVDQKIEPNTLPDNLTYLTFGYNFDQKIEPNSLPKSLTILIFGDKLNQKIELNSLPKNLTILTFGDNFNQGIDPNTLPENLTTLIFGWKFNQKIKSNILPENLSTLIFGWKFNQKIANILNEVKYINFDYRIYGFNNFDYRTHPELDINKINNISKNYNVKVYMDLDIFGDNGPKWPIYVINYDETKWSSDIYEIINKHFDPIYGDITVLINKESYEPYSHAKFALK